MVMFKLNNKRRAVTLAAMTALLCSPAMAGFDDATFTVSVQVLSSCTVSAGDLDFGTYDGNQNDAQSTISVNCTGQTPYTVELNGGEAGDTAARVMTGDTHATTLGYQLYQDGARSSVFGEGAEDKDLTGTGANQSVTVYGRMAAGQTLTEDTYDDVVTVTVTY